ncbi:hypothetical protein E1A91_D09G117500v1 [Gossypium mustelinum]|uniref:Uncharacterized protein n=1 Tax=Gossypium mustelinum TaxID=34275 RepID=A0A5D2TIA2_GOSMU|nr:hypothetical protein E1A91_D09G117500v1 [Gossypium mustelinum]
MAKNAWDILETAHEGASVVKQLKMQKLTSKFEGLRIFCIWGEVFKYQTCEKGARSLLERFLIKITAIEEAKNLEQLVIDEILDSLQTFEKIDCKFSSFHI